MDARVRALLTGFKACGDDAARRDFVFAHPVVIHLSLVQRFLTNGTQLGANFLKAIQPAGARVGFVGKDGQEGVSVSFNPDRYPVGTGPIEAVWAQLEARSITLEVAVSQVRQPSLGEKLTYTYVKALCDRCYDVLVQGQRELAWSRQRLVVEATEALAGRIPLTTDDDVFSMRFAAARVWLEVCSTILARIADPRLLRHADQIGARVLAEARRRKDRVSEAWLLQRLGVLWLDPYTAGTSFDDRHNYEFLLRLWQERLRDYLGPEFDRLEPKDRTMPPVHDALVKAEGFFRAALAVPDTPTKRETIPALLQGLIVRGLLGDTVALSEKIALAREGLAAWAGTDSDERIFRLRTWLNNWLAQSPEPDTDRETGDADVERLLTAPIADLVKAFDVLPLNGAVTQAVSGQLSRGRNRTGLALLDRFRPSLFDPELTNDKARERLWDIEVKLVRNWLAGPLEGQPADAQTASGEQPGKQVADLLTTALRSSRKNEEAAGLKALHDALALDPGLFSQHHQAFRRLRATLTQGEGTNLFNARRMPEAAVAYAHAMSDFADLELREGVFDCLDRLKDVLVFRDHRAMYVLIRQLEPIARKVEALTGEGGTRRLQHIYRAASAFWLTPSGETAVDLDTVFRTLRLAKGHWLANALQSPVHYDWRDDPEAVRQIERIEAMASALGLEHDSGWGGDGAVAESMLIGQAGAHEQRPGSDAEEQYENLRLAFDAYIKRRQVLASADLPADVGLAAFQRTIATGGIVLDLFAGADAEGRPLLHILAITDDSAALHAAPLAPDPGGDPLADPLARLVQRIREGVTAMPGFLRPVSPAAEAALLAAETMLLGPVRPFLAEQRARGREHLLVVPHGPLHFLPLHLLGAVDAPVAQDWLVTYLPVAAMLGRGPLRPDPDATPRLAAIGLDFRGGAHLGVPAIDGAPDFVRTLATAADGVALVNEEATEAHVTAVLQTATAAHIFTHGQQCAYAAAFHALYLAPDAEAGADGILRAYEILPLRCEGLDVLTLSACESALGRFDGGDNLTGLPGSLLLAGARRVVGTLWPVANDVATCFFLEFYRAVREQAGLSQAFRRAQVAARASHREYRDWGAFYFMGPPDDPAASHPRGSDPTPLTRSS